MNSQIDRGVMSVYIGSAKMLSCILYFRILKVVL